MNTKAHSLFETLHAELNGENLQLSAQLTEVKAMVSQQLDVIDRLTDRNNDLEGRNNTLQDTIMSLTSQMDHWKREAEAAAAICTHYRDACVRFEKREEAVLKVIGDYGPKVDEHSGIELSQSLTLI